MHLSNFIQRLQPELEDIQQDLDGLPLNISDCKVADFGCGSGYSTLSLMLHLHAIDCIGVDKYNFWELPTLEEALQQFNNGQDAPTASLTEKVKQLLAEERWPRFQLGDVLEAEKLPKNIDLAYCKLLLGNILGGDFNNSPNGLDGFNRTINNLAACMTQGGLFCLVEKNILTKYLERSDLEFLGFQDFVRREITPTGERRWLPMTVYVHFYRKL